ncbi:transposase [Paenibacillus kribbensis]|uniref:transposase n=1 Tax=Paenibacillus kribbensis TaxID=172713 RepID=UPI0026B2F968
MNTKRNGQEHRDFLVRSHVNQIRDVHREMSDVENHIRDIMQKLDFKLNTFTGIDNVTASAIVAEIGDISRFTSADKLAKYAGLTPSQMSSGGRGKDRNQRQGNRVKNELLSKRISDILNSNHGVEGLPEVLNTYPCCEFKTLPTKGEYDICPVCF